jgi:hypothetical protein
MIDESTFTAPRVDCPHPERWTCPDEQATEVEVSELVAALVTALQPDVVIETGTYLGHTARRIGEALVRNGQGRLVTMEPDADRHAAAVFRVGDDLPVDVLQRESLSVSCEEIRSLAPGHVGLAWFDSLLELRVAEFEHFSALFDERTIVGFHDAGAHHGDWSDEVRRHPRLATIDLPTPRGCIIARVRRPANARARAAHPSSRQLG